jgi:hypothetical protein
MNNSFIITEKGLSFMSVCWSLPRMKAPMPHKRESPAPLVRKSGDERRSREQFWKEERARIEKKVEQARLHHSRDNLPYNYKEFSQSLISLRPMLEARKQAI